MCFCLCWQFVNTNWNFRTFSIFFFSKFHNIFFLYYCPPLTRDPSSVPGSEIVLWCVLYVCLASSVWNIGFDFGSGLSVCCVCGFGFGFGLMVRWVVLGYVGVTVCWWWHGGGVVAMGVTMYWTVLVLSVVAGARGWGRKRGKRKEKE